MILDEIVMRRKEQLARSKAMVPYADMVNLAENSSHPIRNFKKSLLSENISIIAEIKKSSPSKGLICEYFNPVEIAEKYQLSGADAISVLTEEFYFGGKNEYLTAVRNVVSIPILRKDFIIDEYQIYEARAIGADAILLIASLLDYETLIEFKCLSSELGLHVLAEVHDEEDLKKVLDAKLDIVGINNRNLKTFEVNLHTTERLIKLIPEGKIVVSESGIKCSDDMKLIKGYGADAVLVGEALMKNSSVSETFGELRGKI